MAFDTPETRYVRVDGLNVAYQICGSGPGDLVFFAGSFSHVDVWWDHPVPAGVLRALASFSRLILFDRRGIGASDPLPAMEVPHWRTWTKDLEAVLDAVGSRHSAIFAALDGGPPALAFAADHPERVSKLVLFNSSARIRRAGDYPCGLDDLEADPLFSALAEGWGTEAVATMMYPDRANDLDFLRWNAKYQRASVSPGRAAAFARAWFETDAREVVPRVTMPTLVIQRSEHRFLTNAQGRWLADHLPKATFVSVPGRSALFSRDAAEVIDRVCRFVAGRPLTVAIEDTSRAPVVPGHDTLRLLGRGGMGEVWEARRERDGERVAVKVLGLRATPELHQRLEREANVGKALSHPSVVRVHELTSTSDGSPAIVMELLEGETLADKLVRDHVLDESETASILVPVISAIVVAHASGVVHRDLKPANIFLARGGGAGAHPKVLDFGIAKVLREHGDTTRLTASGALLGTPAYMAPEQLLGDAADHRADIWALGLVAFEMLTGELPTRTENMGRLLKLVMTRAAWDPREHVPTIAADVAAIITRMLATEPALRPELREALDVLRPYAVDVHAATLTSA